MPALCERQWSRNHFSPSLNIMCMAHEYFEFEKGEDKSIFNFSFNKLCCQIMISFSLLLHYGHIFACIVINLQSD